MRHAIARTLAALCLAALAALPAAAQVISIEPQSYDFGQMQQQETRTTFIKVTNKGAGMLVIDNVEASCGCTIPTLNTKQLAPGESTEITVEFNSKKFSGHEIKTVKIYSNDPLNPVVDFMISADVQTPLIITPANQRIGFTRAKVGDTQTDRVTFRATNAPKLEIGGGESRQGIFTTRIINNLDGDPQSAALEVTLAPTAPAGQVRDNARVTTNIPGFETVDIEMSGWRLQTLVANPDAVSFRYKRDFRQDVRVAPFEKGTEFKVTGAEIDLPEIKVEVDERIPNAETIVRLTGAPIAAADPRAVAAKGHIEGTLKIHTNLSDQPTIEIPVRYMVRM